MSRADKQVVASENTERHNWSKKLDYILACLGYAVGLGNFWRFPYICMKNGGGAFLIPYFLFLFLCGIPLFFLEVSIGQFASLSPPSVWKLCPLFKGIGYGSIIFSFIGCAYYIMVLVWALYYLGHSFTSQLPWGSCNNTWNTPNCTLRSQEGALLSNNISITDAVAYGLKEETYLNESLAIPISHNITTSSMKRTSTEEFWQFQMLQLSPGIDVMGGMRWQLVLCLGAAWVLIFLCICNGIKSAGKVVYVTVPLPYILLTVLLVRGCLLPGSFDGIKFYLVPEFERLLHFDVWVEACIQVVFSLGPALGTLVTLASYNRFNNNCFVDAIIIPLMNCASSFLSGFVIFTVLGFMAKEANLPVKEVITAGPGLAFIVYPEALTKLPVAPLWAVLFFIMIITLGMDSLFTVIEMIVSGLCDIFPSRLRDKKTIVTAVICILQFAIGLIFTMRGGLYVFLLVDWYLATVALILIGILECVVITYMYGLKRFCYDVEMMIGHKSKVWWMWWKICWSVLCPGIMVVIFVMTCLNFHSPFYGTYTYPSWAVGLGWVIALVSVVPIPLIMIAEVIRAKGTLRQRLRYLVEPDKDWGPALEKHRSKYIYGRRGKEANYMLQDTLDLEEKYMINLSSI